MTGSTEVRTDSNGFYGLYDFLAEAAYSIGVCLERDAGDVLRWKTVDYAPFITSRRILPTLRAFSCCIECPLAGVETHITPRQPLQVFVYKGSPSPETLVWSMTMRSAKEVAHISNVEPGTYVVRVSSNGQTVREVTGLEAQACRRSRER